MPPKPWSCCGCCGPSCCSKCGVVSLSLLAFLQVISLVGFVQVVTVAAPALADCWYLTLVASVAGLAVFAGLPFTLCGACRLFSASGRAAACGTPAPGLQTPEGGHAAGDDDDKPVPAASGAAGFPFCLSTPGSGACRRCVPMSVCASVILVGCVVAVAGGALVQTLAAAGATEFPEGTTTIAGLSRDVAVTRERGGDGVIRIEASTEADLFFAQGYVQAQTRLWQMDFNRRLVRGRLSEVVGTPTVAFDKLFRTLALPEALDRIFEALPPRPRAACEAYARGINAYLETSPPPTLEHWLFGVTRVARFEPRDTITLALLVALQLTANARQELHRLALVELHGLSRARADELMGPYNATAYPTVLTSSSQQLGTFADITGEHRHNATAFAAAFARAREAAAAGQASAAAGRRTASERRGLAASDGHAGFAVTPLASLAAPLLRPLGVDPAASLTASLRAALLTREQQLASNNFAVHGNHTASGGPILENDPHLAMSSPGVWQGLALRAADTGYDAIGASFPGAPGVILGRSPVAAWGVTTSLNDAQDVFALTEAPITRGGSRVGTGYLHNGSVLAYEARSQTITVAGADDVSITTRVSAYGPVINENGGLAYFGSDDGLYLENGYRRPLALAWSPLQAGAREGVLSALLAMGTPSMVSTWREAQEQLGNYTAPCQSFLMAFKGSGDIGFTAPCLVPRRAPGHDGTYPANGTGEHDWRGFVPFPGMPRTLNPPAGFVATANNRLIPPGGFAGEFQGGDWGSAGWRAERIESMLRAAMASGDGKVSLDEARAVQVDVKSTFAARARRAVLALPASALSEGGRRAQRVIRGWDGAAAVGSKGASAAYAFIREATLGVTSRLPGPLKASYSPFWLLERVFGRAAEAGGGAFGSDAACAAGGEHASCQAALAAALDRADASLRALPGAKADDDDGYPLWGDRTGGSAVHTCVFGHQLLGGSLLDCLASQRADGPGAFHTVSKGRNNYDDDPAMPFVHGPSYRALVDFGAEDAASRFATGPGQSGNAFSPRYGSNIDNIVKFQYEAMATGSAEAFAATPQGRALAAPSKWTMKAGA